MSTPKEIKIGDKFGSLTVIENLPRDVFKAPGHIVKCECGTVKNIRAAHLKGGKVVSCGCVGRRRLRERAESGRVHGNCSGGPTATYEVWKGMRSRCNNPKLVSYPDYGGRGITVCERWNNFKNFLADMGPKPPGHSIDRIDNNGNYEPNNCRWANRKQQERNKRSNKFLTIQSVTRCISEWAEIAGIDTATLCSRIRNGWDHERALTTPVQHRKK